MASLAKCSVAVCELSSDHSCNSGLQVITKPFPNLPLGFWNDEGNKRYKSAYFEEYPGEPVWYQGDVSFRPPVITPPLWFEPVASFTSTDGGGL